MSFFTVNFYLKILQKLFYYDFLITDRDPTSHEKPTTD